MRALVLVATAALVVAPVAARSLQSVPVPRPFPGTGPTSAPASKPAEPAAPSGTAPASPPPPPAPRTAATSRTGAPDIGVQIYPTAEFLESIDAGGGQRYYLYGANAAYLDIVAYYKTLFRSGGRELYKIPPMQQFDLGKFQEDTMVYPPSVVVKDYTWNGSSGYLFVSGTTEKRFRTIIQVVPPTAPTSR